MKDKKYKIYGLVLGLVMLVCSAAFMILVASTGFLLPLLTALCAVLLLGITVGLFFLAIDSRKKARCIIATVIAAVLIALMSIGSYYIYIAQSTLRDIATPEEEYTEIGVYVRKEDPAQKLADIAGYDLGILDVLSRVQTDIALEKMEAELGSSLRAEEFPGIEELADSLIVDKTTDVIVLDNAVLEILDETEGHTEDREKIRELYTVRVSEEDIRQQQHPEETEPTAPTQPEEIVNKDVFTLYISGIDCAGSIARRSRSDVNIIATVNTKTGQVLLVSTPRDFYVPLSISHGLKDKLTHAGIYGIQVSVDTLSMLYDQKIDYYFRVNFDGFKAIIAALGSVTVNSAYDFTSMGYTYVKGENVLDPEAALAFARTRQVFASGDRQRGKNQMEVIKGVIRKMESPALLTNFKGLMDSLAQAFETNMPYEKMAELVQNQLKNGTKWNVVSCSADGKGTFDKPYSQSTNAYVMVPDQETVEHAKDLMNRVRKNEVVTP